MYLSTPALASRKPPTIHIHPEGTARESLFIHTAGGIAIQDYVLGLF